VAGAPRYEHMIGKTIREIAESKEMTPANALFEIMQLTSLKATVFYRDINYDLLMQALVNDRSFIASNGIHRSKESS